MTLRRMRRGGLSALAAALLVGALAACQAVPGSGPVHEGLANLDQGEQPVLQFKPGGPEDGASQEEIVRGFVRAATASADGYAVAREFLSPTYAAQWDPSLGVFVDEGNQPYRQLDEGVGELSLTGLATVDERGTFTPLPSGPETEMRFELEQVAGEWRITSAPNGIILDRTSFAAVWTARQIYFLSADDRLVPETRWFLNRATLSTQIVSELLLGPAAADADALRTAFPGGTVLASNAVPVTAGVAHIELSADVLESGPDAVAQATRQLAASLQSVSGVTGFEIVVNGATVEKGAVAAAEGEQRGGDQLATAVMKDGVLGVLGSGELAPLPGVGARIADLDPLAVTLARDRLSAAVRHRSGGAESVSWISQDDIVQLDVRAGLLDPGLDRFGYVWSYATSAPGAILAVRPGQNEEHLLQLPGLDGRMPIAVRISPGGNRLAVLVADVNGQSAVLTVGVVRDESGEPTALATEAATVVWVSGDPVDLDWIDETRLVALTRSAVTVQATVAPLGQLPLDAGTVANAVEVSGGGSRALIRVLDDNGRLYAPQGRGWQRQSDGVELIARSG